MQGERYYSQYGSRTQSRGPEVFYGHCFETNRMRMMDFTDYIKNVQVAYSRFYGSPASAVQPVIDALSSMLRSATSAQGEYWKWPYAYEERDCTCWCCIRCADIVEYARCGEVHQIPINFDNDTRRERDVTLQLGNFATESGQDVGWQASVSQTQFKLPPCGQTTIMVTVNVDCSKLGVPPATEERRATTVDSCKVVYATLRAEGCLIRPLVIAVAVLPSHCGAYHASCGCGPCN